MADMYNEFQTENSYSEDDLSGGGEQLTYVNEQFNKYDSLLEGKQTKTPVQAEPPQNPLHGDIWIDTSQSPLEIWKKYDAVNGVWMELGRTDLSHMGGKIITSQIGISAVTEEKLAAAAVTVNKIANEAITNDKIAARTILADKIAARTITANEIVAHTITGNEIAARTITANNIQAGSITANEIQANTITASLISTEGLTADVIKGGTIKGVNIDVTTDVKVGRKLYLEWDGFSHEKGIIFSEGYMDSSYDSKITGTTLATRVKGRSAELYASTIADVTGGTIARMTAPSIWLNGSSDINLNGNTKFYQGVDMDDATYIWTGQRPSYGSLQWTVPARSIANHEITFQFLSNGSLIATHKDGRWAQFTNVRGVFTT